MGLKAASIQYFHIKQILIWKITAKYKKATTLPINRDSVFRNKFSRLRYWKWRKVTKDLKWDAQLERLSATSASPLWRLSLYSPELNHPAFSSWVHGGNYNPWVHNYSRGCRIQWFMPYKYSWTNTKTTFIYAWTISYGLGVLNLGANASRNYKD